MAVSLFSEIIDKINTNILDNLEAFTDNVITSITPIVTIMVAIYIAFQGYLLFRGAIAEPILDIVYKILKLVVIVAICLNGGRYLSLIADTAFNGTEEFVSSIVGGESKTFAERIDEFYAQQEVILDAIYEEYSGWTSGIGDAIYRMVLSAIVTFSFFICGALLILNWLIAKILLGVLLIIGPIFIACLIFENTKSLFFSWFGQIVSNIVLLILSSVLGQLVISLIITEINNIDTKGAIDISSLVALLVLPLVVAYVYYKFLGSVSSAIGGGFTYAGSSPIGWALGKLTGVSLRGAQNGGSWARHRAEKGYSGAKTRFQNRKEHSASRKIDTLNN